MIEVERIGKAFGGVAALHEVSLSAPAGTVLGLLGHNGAGKTTLVNILSTMVRPDRGVARVAGLDVVRDAERVRGRIGLTGQFATVDNRLSAVDNLVLVGRLLGAGRRAAAARAADLVDLFGLGAAATRPARGYSGGMRRRLDIAAGLVGEPDVVFLDEPTTGLDPESRLAVWDIADALVAGGATVLLTTQHLEEADRLATDIVVLSGGRTVAAGRPDELKAAIGRRAVHVRLADRALTPAVIAELARGGLAGVAEPDGVAVAVDAADGLVQVVRALDRASADALAVSLSEPTLQDVYLSLSRAAS